MLREYASSRGITLHLCADPDLTVIDAFGVRHQDGRPDRPIARPAVFFVRADGTVAHSRQPENYRLHLKTQDVLDGLAMTLK